MVEIVGGSVAGDRPLSREAVEMQLKKLCLEGAAVPGQIQDMLKVFNAIDSMETLQTYLDVAAQLLDRVETDLVDEVSAKADCFFEAISAVGSLADQTSSLSNAANTLGTLLTEVQERHAKEVAKLEQITGEQDALLRAQSLLGMMLDFVKSQNTIQMMLDTHEFGDASRLVTEKIGFLEGELSGITLFGPILVELREMKVALEKMLQANIIS